MSDLRISFYLHEFLDLHLKSKDNDYIPLHYGEAISVIDQTETVCHVEFYDPNKIYFEVPFENNPTKDNPAVLWRIKAWLISCNLYKIRREKAEIELIASLERREKISILTSAVESVTGLPKELAEALAVKIVLAGNKTAANNFGVKI